MTGEIAVLYSFEILTTINLSLIAETETKHRDAILGIVENKSTFIVRIQLYINIFFDISLNVQQTMIGQCMDGSSQASPCLITIVVILICQVLFYYDLISKLIFQIYRNKTIFVL